MKNGISQILDGGKKLILEGNKFGLLNKYSLKERDFRGDRFKETSENLFEFCDVLSLSKPEIISEIHERYLKSGVDIIATNSLNSNRLSLVKYSLEDFTYELNLSSAKLARNIVTKYSSITWDKPRFAAGALSNVVPETDFNLAESVFSEQIKALYAGRVDLVFFNDIKNEVSLLAGLTAYNKLMHRRKKIGDVILVLSNFDLEKVINTPEFIKDFSSLNFVAVGYRFNVTEKECEQKTLNLSQNFKSIICSFYADTDFSQQEFLEKIAEIKLNEKVKIIGLENDFMPDFVTELSKIF
ncbi:MAG: homocysteine S-methyltransferase family protein [Bacteroidales bacterium]|nr:homocysteine S-methyltransferase family protein [Bacteroidales bacterium]